MYQDVFVPPSPSVDAGKDNDSEIALEDGKQHPLIDINEKKNNYSVINKST